MNNKSLLIVLLTGGLILSALLIRDGMVLLLAIPFLVYLMVGVIQAPTDVTLAAERIIAKSSVSAHESFETRIVIENQGNILINIYLEDALFPAMTLVEGNARSRLSLQAGESAELNYAARAARGVYSWNTLHACASDPFGLFELKRDIPAFGEIIVRPAPIQLRHAPLKPRSTLHSAGSIPARRAGSGTDFWGIREYRAGDSLRHLNWRLAARHRRKFFTNEYEREEIGDFGLILDARRLSGDEALEKALFEHSVSAAAALSENFLKGGNRVALLIFGEAITPLFPGYGKRQLNFVLRNLARARLGANLPLGYLEYFPVRLFPSRSQIVIISAVDARDLETYARLRAFGYDVLLISPDPIEYAARRLPSTKISTLAVRAARVERVVQLKRLLKMGIQVIDWQVNESLEAVFHRVERHTIHQGNI